APRCNSSCPPTAAAPACAPLLSRRWLLQIRLLSFCCSLFAKWFGVVAVSRMVDGEIDSGDLDQVTESIELPGLAILGSIFRMIEAWPKPIASLTCAACGVTIQRLVSSFCLQTLNQPNLNN